MLYSEFSGLNPGTLYPLVLAMADSSHRSAPGGGKGGGGELGGSGGGGDGGG